MQCEAWSVCLPREQLDDTFYLSDEGAADRPARLVTNVRDTQLLRALPGVRRARAGRTTRPDLWIGSQCALGAPLLAVMAEAGPQGRPSSTP